MGYRELHKAHGIEPWGGGKTEKTKTCSRCGEQKLVSELNIEGSIHHRTPVHCLDQKRCNRRRRKREGAKSS